MLRLKSCPSRLNVAEAAHYPWAFAFEHLFYVADIHVLNAHIMAVQDWCHKNFGDRREIWIVSGATFNFSDADAAVAFKLRWC